MPTQDDYGQGIDIPALFDAPNIEALKDSINELVKRGVLRFQSASERNATITAPEPGMMAWLETEQLLTQYVSGAWAVVAAGSNAWIDVPLAAEFSHNGNSNGNFQYRVVNFFGEPTIMFRGAVAVDYPSSNVPGNFTLNSVALPPEARTQTLRTISVPCSDVGSDRIALKADLRPDGFLKVFGTSDTNKPIWIGFNGTFCSL